MLQICFMWFDAKCFCVLDVCVWRIAIRNQYYYFTNNSLEIKLIDTICKEYKYNQEIKSYKPKFESQVKPILNAANLQMWATNLVSKGEGAHKSIAKQPMNNPVWKEIMDLPYLGRLGVRLCLQGHQPIMAAIQATYNTLYALRQGIPPSELQGIAEKNLVSKFDGSEDYERWIEQFLEPDH